MNNEQVYIAGFIYVLGIMAVLLIAWIRGDSIDRMRLGKTAFHILFVVVALLGFFVLTTPS